MNAMKFPSHQKSRSALSALLLAALITAGGCAQIPDLGASATMKPVEQLGSTESFTAPSAAWPGDNWWQAYGDTQLNSLLEEALRDSPNLAIAQVRLRQAGAMTQAAGAPLMPEVTGSANLNEAKHSYNYLTPRQAVPNGWNDYGVATLNLSWEIDFWGKNRAALAVATSEQQAAQAEVAQTRLVLSASVASAYAELLHLFTVRDTAEAALAMRTKTVELFRKRHQFGLETLASVRQVEARQAAADGQLQVVDETIALQRNRIAALMGAGPDRGRAIVRPLVAFSSGAGLPPNLALDLLGRRPDIVAARLRTEATAKRIDQQKAGFYPSVNILAFAGVQSLGIDKLTRSGSDIGSIGPAISLPIFNTERLQGQLRGAHAEYDAAVFTYNATLANALREVADATTSRKALDGQLTAALAAVSAAEEAHNIVSKRYQGSLATYLDVLTAEDQLILAQRGLADIATRALVLDVAMVRALGGGFQSPVEPSNTPANTN